MQTIKMILTKGSELKEDVELIIQPEAEGQFNLPEHDIIGGKGQGVFDVYSVEFAITKYDGILKQHKIDNIQSLIYDRFKAFGPKVFSKLRPIAKTIFSQYDIDCRLKVLNLTKKKKGFIKVMLGNEQKLLPLQTREETIVNEGELVKGKTIEENI